MIVVFTRDAPGIPVEALGQILGVPENELLVIVKTEDGPAVPNEPQEDLDASPQPAASEGIASPGLQCATDHRSVQAPADQDALRADDREGSSEPVRDEPGRRRGGLGQAQEVREPELSPAPIGSRAAPQPEYRLHSLNDAIALAKSQRLELVQAGECYCLMNVLGTRFYPTLAATVEALKRRRY